jgi:hypothetical protein
MTAHRSDGRFLFHPKLGEDIRKEHGFYSRDPTMLENPFKNRHQVGNKKGAVPKVGQPL